VTSKIRVLSEDVSRKIAAGEVVERPAAVVKELVENALDAGASRISVEVRGGGLAAITVTDDGEGMSAQDALLAFERHATSKISRAEDLFSVTTLGFRGEALPSIAAVSRVELTSQTKDARAGTLVRLEAGNVVGSGEVGRPAGTTIQVRDLFYNTPARRKFLRSPQSELRRVVQEMMAFALAYPEVAFRLEHDGRELLQVSRAARRVDRIQQVYGSKLAAGLLAGGGKEAGVELEAYLGRPELGSGVRGEQQVFMNRRHIQSRPLVHAVNQAYGPQISEKHPPVLLFLTVEPRLVDVNVHPTKREVRFSSESQVYELVLQTARRILAREGIQISGSGMTPLTVRDRPVEPYAAGTQAHLDLVAGGGAHGESRPETGTRAENTPPVALWQLHNTYILAQVRGGMVIVDQHAAHERVLYEQMTGSGSSGRGQQLLFPEVLELSPAEWMALEEYLAVFQQLGFTIRIFGGRSAVVEAVPASLKHTSAGLLVRETLDELAQTGSPPDEKLHTSATIFACRGAIKAGDPLSLTEMNLMVDQLFATEIPYACPHGRPTMFKISLEELERRFGRA
jgi:DNA mismatch repair protein MutL